MTSKMTFCKSQFGGLRKPKTQINMDAYYCKSIINWSFTKKLSWLYQRDLLWKVSCNTFLLLFAEAHTEPCQKSKKECCKNCERVINSFNYFRKTFYCRYLTGTWIRRGSAQLLECSHTVYIRKNLFFKLPYLYQKLETVGEVKLSFSAKDSTWVACLHFVLSRICRMLNNKYVLKFV